MEAAMEEKSPDTLERIQQAALDEFSEKGFLGASLRQIVKHAGVTTGAFYGYFSSKEALFASIVEPHAAALMGKFMEAHTTFAELPEEEQPSHMGVESGACIHWMVDYICGHREPVKLLCAELRVPAMSISFTTWWRWKWRARSNTWRRSAAWDMRSQTSANPCAISLLVACSTVFLKS